MSTSREECCWRKPTSGPLTFDPISGDSDEFHMAFHFPLMPRMFMGLKLEDRKPITEILQQTPEIPPVLPVVPLSAQP